MAEPRTPVTTVEELNTFDDAEIMEGYKDGRAGEPEPGDNRSKAYWHGWRTGSADGGHRQLDAHDRELARNYVRDAGRRRQP